MRLSLPKMATVVAPLRALVERHLKGTTLTKRVASGKVMSEANWSQDIQGAWQMSREFLKNVVELNFRKQEFPVLMLPGTSDVFWGGSLTQFPKEVVHGEYNFGGGYGLRAVGIC